MKRPARVTVSHVLWALPGFLFLLLGVAWDVQAATVTDTFPATATAKEWCRGNPRFFENIHVRIHPKDPTKNTTLIFTRDPLNSGDLTNIQATINTQGGAPDIDALTMNGLAFPSNKSGSTDQFVLLGTLNNGHFFAVRGQTHLDKLGNLTKVTGTFMYQITGTYTLDKQGNQSGPVDCFASGTFVTGKKL
jgi:hypothetical protein